MRHPLRPRRGAFVRKIRKHFRLTDSQPELNSILYANLLKLYVFFAPEADCDQPSARNRRFPAEFPTGSMTGDSTFLVTRLESTPTAPRKNISFLRVATGHRKAHRDRSKNQNFTTSELTCFFSGMRLHIQKQKALTDLRLSSHVEVGRGRAMNPFNGQPRTGKRSSQRTQPRTPEQWIKTGGKHAQRLNDG